MPVWEEELAMRHAPVLLQKVHNRYKRADFIARVNFAYRWPNIHRNWDAVWETKAGRYKHKLTAHGYYSVVVTHTHYYLVYAFYHPQDWTAFWGSPARSSPHRINQHVHDMEGCLAVVPRRNDPRDERVGALVTISHHHFYSFAGREINGRMLPDNHRIVGASEDLDGPMQVTERFAGPGEPPTRVKLYSESGGHAIKGAKKDWGVDKRIIRYRPSLRRAQQPDEGGFVMEDDAYFQTARYKLVSMFVPGGLWDQHRNPRVFRTNDKGQEAFVDMGEAGQLVAGSANPPWGWDDRDDRHPPGTFARDPARLVADYFAGLGEFSGEYTHNRFLGIVAASAAPS
jgi:hypothetical protein